MKVGCCNKKNEIGDEIEKLNIFLQAVADKNRLKILCILKEEEKCVCEIFPAVGISDKLVSHHLGRLKKIGLLNERREGNFIYYSLNQKNMKNYKFMFNKIIK